MALSEEECFSTSSEFTPESEEIFIDPTPSEEVIELFRRVEDSLRVFIDIPDSATICYRYPDLCAEVDLGKARSEGVQKPSLSVSSHPTPFNTELAISVTIPYADYLSVSIYNSSGHLVKILYENEIFAGQYRFVWNGLDSKQSEVSSGQYLVRVTTRNETMTEKVILVK
jgi:hypothetical protein